MGTSKSYEGPGDRTPLLPAWAQAQPAPAPAAVPQPVLPPPSNPAPIPQRTEADEDTAANPDILTAHQSNVPAVEPTGPASATGPWKLARIAMTGLAKHGGANGRMREVGRRYVRASDGTGAATRAASSGRSATARLGGFLSDVATRGFAEAARSLGLATIVGQSASTVFTAILNALAPSGAGNEDAVARKATGEVLTDLFERFGVEEGGFDRLDSMDAGAVAGAIKDFVSAFIYQRWLLELGRKIEEGAYSDTDAVRLEREVRAYVEDLVEIDLQGRDAVSIAWGGIEGQQFCERIYGEAYALLEGR